MNVRTRCVVVLVALAMLVSLTWIPSAEANRGGGQALAKPPGAMTRAVQVAKQQALRPVRWLARGAGKMALKAGNVALRETVKAGGKATKSLAVTLSSDEGKKNLNELAGVAGGALGNALREAMASSNVSPKIKITIEVDLDRKVDPAATGE